MNNILDILKNKNPEFYNKLKKAFDEASYELRTDEGMQTTIIADDIQLTSHHDRMHCAEYRCRKLDLNEPVSIYGMGLGDEIRYILEKNPKANINLFILNEALFYFLVQNIEDFTDLLATNVNLIIADDDTPYVKNSIIIPSEVYIDFKHNNKIKIKLANILDYDFASVNSTNRILRFSVNNLNMNKAAKIFDRIKPLNNDDINALKADEYIVLASGPSLKDNIEKIKELQSKGIKTVAVDTALACLNNYNIIPDIIVSHDPIVYVQFKNLILKNKDNFKNTFLICSAHSEQAFIEDYPGPIKYIFDDNDVKIVPEIDCELKNFIKFAGSVLLETTAILKRVSPKKIHLFGCDFAYKGKTTHAGNLYNEVSEKDTKKNYGSFIKILCNDGQYQNTLKSFALYRDYLEADIKASPNTEYINYSKTGAIIKGAKLG